VSAVSGIDLPDATTEYSTRDEGGGIGWVVGSTAEGTKETKDETKPRLSKGYRIPKAPK